MPETSSTRPRAPGRAGPPFGISFLLALAVTGLVRGPRTSGASPASVRKSQGDRTSSRRPDQAAEEPGRGREASSPTEIPPQGWWDILKRVYGEVNEDRILAVAAGVTFFGLLALFPAIGALVALYGLAFDANTLTDHISAMAGLLPGGALDIVTEQIKRITSKGSTTLGLTFFTGLAISLWSANSGMKAVFDALNVAYEEKEKRNFFVLNAVSLAFTLGAVVFLILAAGAVIAIPIVLKFVGLGAIVDWLVWIGRWPVLLLIVLGAIALLYRYGPSRDRAKWRWITPGSTLAAAGLMIFSMLFSWYVGSFGNYNETYGSLGAAIGFMTWMWLSATILLVGAELNAETEHQTAEDTTDGPPAPLGNRGAHMADTVGKPAS